MHFNHFGSNAGGVEGYIADVVIALSRAGHESHLVYFAETSDAPLLPAGMQTSVAAPGGNAGDSFRNMEHVIAALQPDVAYMHAVYDPGVISWIVSKLPVVAYVHGPYLVCPGLGLFWRESQTVCERSAGPACLVYAQLEKCCYGRSPLRHITGLRNVYSTISTYSSIRVLVGSQFMRERLGANGIPAGNINVLPPVLNRRDRLTYSRPKHSTHVLFAGRITAEKGLMHLIRALNTIGEVWHLTIAGDGPDRPNCERLAAELGLQEQTDFVGWLPAGDMSLLYQQCAFVVVPSLWPEPYGRIGAEAFSHGRPVVAFGVGGIPDWLESGQTGYLARPNDIADLAEKVALLLHSPEEQERMGRNALLKAETAWPAAGHVEELLSNFELARQSFAPKENPASGE